MERDAIRNMRKASQPPAGIVAQCRIRAAGARDGEAAVLRTVGEADMAAPRLRQCREPIGSIPSISDLCVQMVGHPGPARQQIVGVAQRAVRLRPYPPDRADRCDTIANIVCVSQRAVGILRHREISDCVVGIVIRVSEVTSEVR